jgi:MoaA/NifB/PqqE/SkfB family radical SAM enzyme
MLEKIRENFLDGEFTEGQCWTCREGRRRGVPDSELLLGDFSRGYPYEALAGNYPLGPASLDIRLGNLCNLRCIHCNSKYSSRHNGNQVTDPHEGNVLFEESFRQAVPYLKLVNFGGGEPLLNDHLYRYLDMILEARGMTTVSYITNLTTLPSRLIERLPRLSANLFQVSLDGVEARYESIRQGARWTNVLSNFQELARNRRAYRIRSPIHVIMSLMERNYEDFEALLDLCINEDARLRINPVYAPHHLSPFHASPDSRRRMAEHFVELHERRSAELTRFCLNPEFLFTL